MSMTFSEGIVAASSYWQSNGRSYHSHKTAVNGLQKYLTLNGISYSPDAAKQWLESNKANWRKSTYIHYRRSLKELELIIKGEPIVKKFDYRENPFDSLPDEWKQIIRAYRNYLEVDLTIQSIDIRIKKCIQFALFACSKGAVRPDNIQAEIISDYSIYLSPEGTECNKQRSLFYFLKFLSDQKMLDFHRALIITSPLQGKAYAHAANSFKQQRIIDSVQGTQPSVFWNNAVKFVEHMVSDHGFGRDSIQHNYMDYLQMYYIVCEENCLPVSTESQELWLSVMKPFWDNYRRSANAKRAFTLCNKFSHDHILTSQELCRQHCADKSNAKHLGEYYKNLLDGYVSDLRRENLKESTIKVNKTAVISFLLHIQNKDLSDINNLKATDVKSYFQFLSDESYGKNRRHVYVIKSLLESWYDKGLIVSELSYAVPVGFAPTRRIVEILSNEEVNRIYEYRNNAKTAMQYRDSAVLLLGLMMGLRKIDIINLRFSDIDWKKCTISITQQKTYRPLTLPMPAAVGNSIYNYIKNGRPDFKVEYIFLSAVKPYRRANVAICDAAINKVLPERNVSFHILRRTFASSLLKNGSSVDMIKETLGHSSLESVNRYLSVDDEALKSCCLPLERTVM